MKTRILFFFTLCCLVGLFLAQTPARAAEVTVDVGGEVGEWIERIERAREVLAGAQRVGDYDQIIDARRNLDQTKIEALAAASGRSPSEIASMRASGMGWGKIAKSVGAHPSVLGAAKGSKGVPAGYVVEEEDDSLFDIVIGEDGAYSLELDEDADIPAGYKGGGHAGKAPPGQAKKHFKGKGKGHN